MNLLAAINTAKDNFKQENPKVGVINISVGTMPLREFRGEKVYKAITEVRPCYLVIQCDVTTNKSHCYDQAIQTGMHVVLAAGNDGKDLVSIFLLEEYKSNVSETYSSSAAVTGSPESGFMLAQQI